VNEDYQAFAFSGDQLWLDIVYRRLINSVRRPTGRMHGYLALKQLPMFRFQNELLERLRRKVDVFDLADIQGVCWRVGVSSLDYFWVIEAASRASRAPRQTRFLLTPLSTV
jgi:hypothetical protein